MRFSQEINPHHCAQDVTGISNNELLPIRLEDGRSSKFSADVQVNLHTDLNLNNHRTFPALHFALLCSFSISIRFGVADREPLDLARTNTPAPHVVAERPEYPLKLAILADANFIMASQLSQLVQNSSHSATHIFVTAQRNQSENHRHARIQNRRSASASRGRGCCRCKTSSCCRRHKISITNKAYGLNKTAIACGRHRTTRASRSSSCYREFSMASNPIEGRQI